MAKLIDTIPVNTPQIAKNPYPQLKKYDYIPAKPLSIARTQQRNSRPVVASGSIINENIFQSAYSTVKSYKEYAENFYKAAFKGEGKDYEIGKINDLSIRAGSLGIATILATTKFFPFAKGMEFVGFGTWFASMALWPRLIGAPIKALTGVNINQKYRDSFGRRKDVFEDNQYRPMDLYRHLDEKGRQLTERDYYNKYNHDYVYLEKLANKMKIPEDKPNRHEATMQRMGQIAVQGRTLSMLTAGIMTPVLSSVIADSLQPVVSSSIENVRKYKNLLKLKKIENILNVDLLKLDKPFNNRSTEVDIDNIFEKFNFSIPKESKTKFESIIGEKIDINPNTIGEAADKAKALTKKEYNELLKFFDSRLADTGLGESFKIYLANMSSSEPYVLMDKELQTRLYNSTNNAIADYVAGFEKLTSKVLPDSIKNIKGLEENEFVNVIKNSFGQSSENYANNFRTGVTTNLNVTEMNSFKSRLFLEIRKKLSNAGVVPAMQDAILRKIKEQVQLDFDAQVRHFIDGDKNKIISLYKFVELDKLLNKKVKDFENVSISNISESMTARSWEKLPQEYLKIVGFNSDEIAKLATMDSSQASKVIGKRFEEIVKNEQQYEAVLRGLSHYAAKAIEKEEKAAATLIGTIDRPGVYSKIKDLMNFTANYNFDWLGGEVNKRYSLHIKDIIYKLRNTTDSFVRPIKALDTFKNIDKNVISILGGTEEVYKSRLKDTTNFPQYYMFRNMSFDEAKASLTAFIKDIVLDKNDINNWTTKFEHDLPGGKKGMKHALPMLREIANVVNGDLSKETKDIVDSQIYTPFKDKVTMYDASRQIKNQKVQDFVRDYLDKKDGRSFINSIAEKLDKLYSHYLEDSAEFSQKFERYIAKLFKLESNLTPHDAMTFSQKCNVNNSIMRFRFLRLECKLAKIYHSPITSYMADYFPSEGIINEICHQEGNDKVYLLKGWLSECREQLDLPTITEIKNIINKKIENAKEKINIDNGFRDGVHYNDNLKNKLNSLYGKLGFASADKEISEMAGKNVTDFFIGGAQNIRSRAKWAKLAYGLLIGTTVFSAAVISMIGRDNYFNHIIKPKSEIEAEKKAKSV